MQVKPFFFPLKFSPSFEKNYPPVNFPKFSDNAKFDNVTRLNVVFFFDIKFIFILMLWSWNTLRNAVGINLVLIKSTI